MEGIARVGEFLAELLRAEVIEGSSSSSKSLRLYFMLHREFLPRGDQVPLTGGPYSAEAFVNVIKKDGTWNTGQVTMLRRTMRWPGFDGIADWRSPMVRITTKSEEYKGVVRWRADRIDPPEGRSGADPTKLKQLQTQYQADLNVMFAAIDAGQPIPELSASPAPAIPAPLKNDEIPF